MKHQFEFIEPVDEVVLDYIERLPNQALGKTVRFHTDNESPFDLSNIRLALLSIKDKYDKKTNVDFSKIREQFYSLFPGNWDHAIADLGTVVAAENFEHTNYLLQNTLEVLIKNNIIPIILGGSQKYAYSNYRAYESLEHLVNVVNIDHRFDLGNASIPIEGHSFAGKMVVEKPIILFNYANLGYQSYLNPIEETDLMENLYFEKYRLGEIKSDITLAEPVLRDADIVCIDYNSIKSNETGFATL
ncbi:MAG: arginase family protein, partial [Flavobacteriaceae bacterium]|nr:arginase family protein [Flavobacteriaceae bacterium]